ncbi:hypothetical protein [Epilithonimonas hispanica]|uniref:YD repeat-containing protein n=1 Tax=Epilithonimonas hispanica TaxID=358687 RepID=A0A3D9CJU7_9FLAO|nr:hypothetical protein [Epilithonimonas hispanica]REC66018.1 hypothetical protein DRF58_17270 [Epilithonimonas hispanica]
MRKKLYSTSLLLVTLKIFGQGAMSPVEIKSPQSYAFEKYGNIPVNLYTGSIDLRIPIASIGEKGLDISATLVYDSSGFIPHKKSDAAGVNWSLIAGGRITRNLNRIPDEYVGSPTTLGGNPYDTGKDLHGFLKGVKTNPSTNTQAYNLYGGTGNTDGQLWWWMGPSANGYEGTPDSFSFNAMGLSGKFIIGNDGNVLVESNDPNIRVDISQMAIYGGRNFCTPPVSKITIKDGQGNQYIFGGDLSKYEISYSYSTDPASSHPFFQGYPMISSFSLSKIIFANNKEINFTYEEGTLNDNFCNLVPWTNAHNNEKLLSLETYNQDGARVDEWRNCPGGVSCGYEMSSGGSNTITYILLKKSILKSIRYLDDEIKINYIDAGYPIKQDKLTSQFFNEWLIDNIETYHNNTPLKKTQFSYDHLGGTFKRPFLKSIKDLKTDQIYSFEYNKTTTLPAYYTKGIDHWGYWNGKDTNVSLAPFDTYNATTGDYTLNNTFRDANPQKYDVALLSKVIYPTKGYSIFEYEPQFYGKRVERISSSLFLPTLTNNSGLAGGARIKKIFNYAENGVLSTEKEYRYTTTLNGSSNSGILMNWPRYFYYIEMSGSSMVQKLMIKTSSNVQQNSLDSYNVGYSKVFEIDKNKGYIEHNFTTYETHPDLLNPDPTNTRQYMTGYTNFVPLNLYKNFKNLYGVDKSILRGKPLNQKYFSQSDLVNPIKVVNYEYYDNMDYNPNNSKDNNNYVSINHLTGYWVQGYRKFMNSAPVKKITTTDYLNNAALNSYQEFFYNSSRHLNLVEEKSTYTDGAILSKKYQYPEDVRHGNQAQQNIPPYQSTPYMVGKNMVGIPLITSNYKNNIFQNRQQVIFDYNPSSTLALPKSSIQYFEDQTITTPNNGYGSAIVPNPNYGITTISYDQYNSTGNLQQYTTKEGIPTAIVWGYNQTQPIAKIEGATYAQVSNLTTAIINASNDDNADTALGNPKENDLLTALDTFRANTALAGYQITTYSYDPLIGVRSITPPSGIREIYIYDTANRLKEVRDVNGNILNSYEYHYKP